MAKSLYRLLEEVFDIEKRKQIVSMFENFRSGKITEHDFVTQLEELSQVLSREYMKGRPIPSIRVAKDASYVALVDLSKSGRSMVIVSERVLSELGSEATAAAFLYYLGAALFYSRWQRFLKWSVMGVLSVSGLSLIAGIIRGSIIQRKNKEEHEKWLKEKLVKSRLVSLSYKRRSGDSSDVPPFVDPLEDEWFNRFVAIFTIASTVFILLGLIWIFGNIFSKGRLSKDKFFVYKLGFAGDLARYFDYMKGLLVSYVSDNKLISALARDSIKERMSTHRIGGEARTISVKDLLKGFKKFIKKESSRLGVSSEDQQIIAKQISSLEELSRREGMDEYVTAAVTLASEKMATSPSIVPTVSKLSGVGNAILRMSR